LPETQGTGEAKQLTQKPRIVYQAWQEASKSVGVPFTYANHKLIECPRPRLIIITTIIIIIIIIIIIFCRSRYSNSEKEKPAIAARRISCETAMARRSSLLFWI